MKQPVLVNAQEMMLLHPLTFEAPTMVELLTLKVGDSVKISCCNERFWVIVTNINFDEVQGTVDNNLIFSEDHGLDFGDLISFKLHNIYNILTKE